jgi:O-antigen biosynthesis protein
MKDSVLPHADVPVAVLVDDDTVLLYGTADRPAPAEGDARLDGDAATGRFHGLSWPKPDGEEGYCFVGALRVAGLAKLRPGRIEVATAGDGEGRRFVVPRLTNLRINPWLLISALKEEQPEALPKAVDFFVTRLTASGEPASERTGRLVLSLVQALAQKDGFAEIFGRFRGPGLFIQGWSFSLRAGSGDLLVETDDLRLHRAVVGEFRRGDLPPSAQGFVAVLPDAELDPRSIRRIFHRSSKGWSNLDVFENRTLLPPGVGASHLRDMLSELGGDAEAERTLRCIASSQYEGVETVSRLEAPVRTALDLALRVPGTGVFLSGWMLDPSGHVEAVTLHGPGLAGRLDPDWARLPRRDVSQAFGAHPPFLGRIVPGMDAHGFLAFVPEPDGLPADAEFHLSFRLIDGTAAFLPVAPLPPTPDLLPRLLGSVDIGDPAAEAVVARHVGPVIRAAAARRAPSGPGRPPAVAHPMGRENPAPRLSVILPVADAREDIDLNLARLAVDPDFADAEIVVALAAGTHERLPLHLRRAAAFYRLCVRLVAAPHAHGPFEAIAAALPHARAEQVLLLSCSVLPTGAGWLSDLQRAALAAGRPAMVSPTLLYEDHSIRFAGIMAEEGAEAGFAARYAGYPGDWPKEREPTAVDAATADCALLPKRLLAEAGDFGAGYIGEDYRGLDLCLRLRAAGHLCLWVPAVRLIALEEGPREDRGEPWRHVAALVDRWGFETAWADRPAA